LGLSVIGISKFLRLLQVKVIGDQGGEGFHKIGGIMNKENKS
jgi:hypothetical protein